MAERIEQVEQVEEATVTGPQIQVEVAFTTIDGKVMVFKNIQGQEFDYIRESMMGTRGGSLELLVDGDLVILNRANIVSVQFKKREVE